MGRHMRLITAAIVALVALVVCTDSQSGGPTGLRPSADLLDLTDPTSVEAFVTTGGVDVVFVEVGVPQLTTIEEPKQHISYDAKQLRDGDFQGEFQAQVKIGGALVALHGTIKCFVTEIVIENENEIEIEKHRARVLGMVTSINAPLPEGVAEPLFVQWTGEDNGEGSEIPPDRQSKILPVANTCPSVANETDALLMPTVRGNIQIHPTQSSN
jgi:hypothetical protein